MPGFNTSFEVEQKLDAKTTQKDITDGCLKCPTCKTSWFEEVRAQQYIDDHGTVLGQPPPAKVGGSFILLRCCKCGDLSEPRVLRNARDTANKLYDNFIDSLKSGEIKSESV